MAESRPEKQSHIDSSARLEVTASEYISYLTGVSWLHNPEATRPVHGINPDVEPDTLIYRAYEKMRGSSQEILKTAHGLRGLKPAYRKLDEARPFLDEMVAFTFTNNVTLSRVKLLLPADDHSLELIQPAPFRTLPAHDYLVAGREAAKLTIPMLMGNVSIDPDIELFASKPTLQLPQM